LGVARMLSQQGAVQSESEDRNLGPQLSFFRENQLLQEARREQAMRFLANEVNITDALRTRNEVHLTNPGIDNLSGALAVLHNGRPPQLPTDPTAATITQAQLGGALAHQQLSPQQLGAARQRGLARPLTIEEMLWLSQQGYQAPF